MSLSVKKNSYSKIVQNGDAGVILVRHVEFAARSVTDANLNLEKNKKFSLNP